jgi:hypothetical protein
VLVADTYLPEGAERPRLAQGTRLEDGQYVDITDTTYSKSYFADGGDGAGPGTGYGLGLQSVVTDLGTEYGHGGGMYGFNLRDVLLSRARRGRHGADEQR